MFESNTSIWWPPPNDRTKLIIFRRCMKLIPKVDLIEAIVNLTGNRDPNFPIWVNDRLNGMKLKPSFKDACIFVNDDLHAILKVYNGILIDADLYEINEPRKTIQGTLNMEAVNAFAVEVQIPIGGSTMKDLYAWLIQIKDGKYAQAFIPRFIQIKITKPDSVKVLKGRFLVPMINIAAKTAFLKDYPFDQRFQNNGAFVQLTYQERRDQYPRGG